MDKYIDAFAQYGLLGLVLAAIGVGAWRVWRDIKDIAIKPAIDAHVKQQERAGAAIEKYADTMNEHARNEEKIMLRLAEGQEQIAMTQSHLAEIVKEQVKKNGG